MEVKEIMELMKAVSDNGLTKFELELGDMKLVMKREKEIVSIMGSCQSGADAGYNGIPVVHGADSIVYTNLTGHAPGQVKDAQKAEVVSGNTITCPLVGTFYASPSPEAECFVKVGDRVKKGQVVGIVEAMKLMNEIESEYDGVIEEILVNNEDTVGYGQPLFVIR